MAIAGPGIRSIMSKAIAVEDQGKTKFTMPDLRPLCACTHTLSLSLPYCSGALFSIIAGVQVLASVTAAVVFFYFYPATLKMGWRSGSVYFLIAVLLLLAIPGVV